MFLTAAGFYIYDFVKKIDFNQVAENYLTSVIKDKLNGSIRFEDLKLTIVKRRLVFNVASITLFDAQGQQVFQAKNSKLVWSFRNILSFTSIFKKISADELTIFLIKEPDGKWNYEKLLKDKRKKPLKIQIRELDIPLCNINIKDLVANNAFDHELKLYFKRQGEGADDAYQVNLLSRDLVHVANGSSMTSSRFDDFAKSGLKNLISVNGIVDLHSWQGLLQNSKKLYVDLYDISDLNLELLNNILFTEETSLYKKFFNKYIPGSSVSVQANLDNVQGATDKACKLRLQVNNFATIPKIELDASMTVGKNLYFNSLALNSQPSVLNLKGQILNWREKTPGLQLNLVFNNVNIASYREKISELDTYVPDFIMQILALLHNSKYFFGELNFTEAMTSPRIKLEIPLVNYYTITSGKAQSLKADLRYLRDELLLDSFELPVEFSKVTMKGKFNLKNESLDLNLVTEDLPLERVKPIVTEFPILSRYKAFLSNSLVQGYTSFNANVHKNAKTSMTNNGIVLDSKIKLAGVNFVSNVYPIGFSKLNADLEISNTLLKILNLNSLVSGDYIEARGEFDLKNPDKLSLEFAAPKLNSATLIKSNILKFVPKNNIDLNYAEGNFKDMYLLLSNPGTGLKLTGKMDFDTVDLVVNNLYEFYDLKGEVGINNNTLKFDNFSFFLGEESSVKANGLYDFTGNGSQLKVIAQKVNFVDLISLVDPAKKLNLDPKGGFVDFDLTWKGKAVTGKVALDKVDLLYKGLKFIKYPFFDLKGNVVIDKNITLSNASGFYGSSNFKNLFLNLRNLKTTNDKFIDLNFQGNVLVDEYYDLIPSGIRKFLRMKGTLPLTLSYSGNKQKKTFDINANLDKLTYFKFAEWLDLSNKYNVTLRSKLVVTPQLIASDDSEIIFAEPSSGISTKVGSVYQVKDWSNLDELNYYLHFTTPMANSDLRLLEPSVISLKPMNLFVGLGGFVCDTYGDNLTRQTVCDFDIQKATARKYGIGDLNANNIAVGLMSIANKPLDVEIAINNGDWNTIPYKKLDFDLRVNGDFIYVNNLKAKIANGKATGSTIFNYKTLESSFDITGHRIPAHEFVQGVWGLGDEVPEGVISGTFKGTTQGVLPDPMFYNLVGTANVIAKNGKLSALRSMQKILTAVNTLKNFDVNNVFQILVTFKGGLFSSMITSLHYDHGKISTERALLKAEQIELDMNGFVDFKSDQLWVSGKGLIPKHSKSILQTVGVGGANLGNLFSMINPGADNEKRFFEFQMIGPVTDMNKSAESLKSNFKWL